MRIIFTGGGTLGSVTPLLALYEELCVRADRDEYRPIEARWIGTRNGIERSIITSYCIPFYWVLCAKLRRYFDVRNFIDPVFLLAGFIQSIALLLRFRPDFIISAGGYVSVPLLWAGWLLRIRSVIFQLDLRPSLSNILTSFCADAICVACEDELQYFPKNKTVVTGIPIRRHVYEVRERMASNTVRTSYINLLGFRSDIPFLLVMGGGTGADALNALVYGSLASLVEKCQVLHITGRGKCNGSYSHERYRQIEFAGPELLDYCALADLVVTRAGMGSLAELSALGKPCVIIPIPESHQEYNAIFFEQRQCAVYLAQNSMTPELFSKKIIALLSDTQRLVELEKHIECALPLDGACRAADYLLIRYE